VKSQGERPSRGERVAERVRAELMELLLRGVVRDPAVEGCFVSDVKLSADLRHARVYVRLTRPDPTEQDQERLVAALDRASGFIQREIAPRLALKYQPHLRFFWDEGTDHAQRVEALLEEIGREGERGGEA
jgi:ribosome-binding factor A